MLNFLFDLGSIIVGAIFPIFQTWRVLKSKRTTGLVPLAKYWVVFGAFWTLETVANFLFLPAIIPCYSFLKFMTILYVAISGYDHLYRERISPLLHTYEPRAELLFILVGYIRPLLENYSFRAIHFAATYTSDVSIPSTKNDDHQALIGPVIDNKDEFELIDQSYIDNMERSRSKSVISHEDQSDEEEIQENRGSVQPETSNENFQELHGTASDDALMDVVPNRNELTIRQTNPIGIVPEEIRHCSCTTGCSNKRCSCYKTGMNCGPLCHKNSQCHNK